MTAAAFRRGLGGVIATSLLLVGGGCDEMSPDATAREIAVTVGPGTTPEYGWDGGAAFTLTVFRRTDLQTPVWGLVTPGGDRIVPPVTHGQVPSGVDATFTNETPLTAGIEYRVVVRRFDGLDSGFTDFVP